jgi:hypothetical protein
MIVCVLLPFPTAERAAEVWSFFTAAGRRTRTQMLVAFVKTPVVVVAAVATKETTVSPTALASPVCRVAQAGTVPLAAGTEGAAAVPRAETIIRSPAAWAGMATDVAAADACPTTVATG